MAITLEIRSMRSSDVEDLRNWDPTAIDRVFFPLEIEIGERGAKDANVFYALVATPEALRKQAAMYEKAKRPFPDRNLLVLPEYSWRSLEDRIERIVASCARDSWNESVACLNRYFRWEYEDYFRLPPP